MSEPRQYLAPAIAAAAPVVPVLGAPLEQARAAFAWLTRGPGPLTVDGRAVPGLPARPIPVDDVRDRLTHPACPPVLSDAIWAHLIRRARRHGGTATVVCVGCAVPALSTITRQLCAGLRPRRARSRAQRPATTRRVGEQISDIETAVLSGFLTELALTDLRAPGVELRLRSAAHEAGRLAVRHLAAAPIPHKAAYRSCPPPAPARHPDLVLARAVAAQAITHSEAVLIGATRLEPISLDALARSRGQAVRDVRAARVRAERKLAEFLRDSALSSAALPATTGTYGSAPTQGQSHRERSRPRDSSAGAATRASSPRTQTDPSPMPGDETPDHHRGHRGGSARHNGNSQARRRPAARTDAAKPARPRGSAPDRDSTTGSGSGSGSGSGAANPSHAGPGAGADDATQDRS